MLMETARCYGAKGVPYTSLPASQPAIKTGFNRLIESAGVQVSYARDVEIYGEGEPSEYFYKVLSGAVRTYRVLVDGRRQIFTFNMRGDFFGFETEDWRGFSADAVANSKLLVIKRSAVMTEVGRDVEIARQIWGITGTELKRVQAHVLLLIKTARERVIEFLMEMALRATADGVVELPMCRQDIADYLGLTIETVSRTFADLERSGAIGLPNSRRVILLDRRALAADVG